MLTNSFKIEFLFSFFTKKKLNTFLIVNHFHNSWNTQVRNFLVDWINNFKWTGIPYGTLFARNQETPSRQLGGALLTAPCLTMSRHSSIVNSTTSIISSSIPPPLASSLSESVTSQ